MGKFFKKQFSARAFGLAHDRPNEFAVSSWQKGNSPVPMLAVRLVLAAATAAVWLWSLLDGGVSGFWFIYLTNWGLMLLTATTCCAVLVSFMALCYPFPDMHSTPWFVSCYWLLYNIATPIAFLISVFYWSVIYDSGEDMTWNEFAMDLATHGGNSAVVMVELLASRTPSRFLHFYQPFGFGVWYAIFSSIYYGVGGLDENGNPYVYAVLNWSDWAPTLGVVCATAAGLLALHALVVCAAALRNSLSSALVRRNSHDLPPLPAHHPPGRTPPPPHTALPV